MRKLIAGNWKMNGALAANRALIEALLAGVQARSPACDVAVCPPAVYLAQLQALLQGQDAIALGAQDVSEHEAGAFTGNVAAAMLREFGVRYAIVGHSERRSYQGESDAQVALKAQRALAAGITPIVCVGETLQEREQGQTEAVVTRQLDALLECSGARAADMVLAYEPLWAIGTGHAATPQQAQEVHAALRARLRAALSEPQAAGVRILYGGSMNAANAVSLLAQPVIDGGLVGGASLKAQDFLEIIAAAG
ncbi:MAG: triose-phosphate isomerase [Ottowia sp.]|nr:triose-phosphate isomerase [Ottowia sp.]